MKVSLALPAFSNSHRLTFLLPFLPIIFRICPLTTKQRITGNSLYRAITHDLQYSMIETRTNFYPKKGNPSKENHKQPQSPELTELEEGNRHIAAENSVILQRIKAKLKTNMELKKRLKQLQNLMATTKPAGASNGERRLELRKHRSVEGFDSKQEAEEMEALEERFNALVVENMEKKGFSRVKIRAEMSELAKRIRDMKSVKVTFKI